MTDAQIKHLVDRFLMWKLPEHFRPDGGISFEPIASKGTPHEFRREPVGTNLLSADQAKAMVRHMIEGLPQGYTKERQMADTINLKLPDLVAWNPRDDITAYELARAIPVLFAMAHGAASSADQAKNLDRDAARHFTVRPNPMNK